MLKSRRSKRSIVLPWERSTNLFGGVLAVRQWRTIAFFGLVLGSLLLLWHSADVDARVRATRSAEGDVRRAVLEFRSDMGRCPHSTVELVHPPRTSTKYLSELPLDGWGRPLWVRCPAHDDPDGVDVISAGPSGNFFLDDNNP